MDRARIEGPVLCLHSNGLQSVPAVWSTVRRRRWTRRMGWLHLWHRAAEAGSVRLMDRGPRLAAAVQQTTMPGPPGELGTITWSAVSRVSARLLCSAAEWLAVESYS